MLSSALSVHIQGQDSRNMTGQKKNQYFTQRFVKNTLVYSYEYFIWCCSRGGSTFSELFSNAGVHTVSFDQYSMKWNENSINSMSAIQKLILKTDLVDQKKAPSLQKSLLQKRYCIVTHNEHPEVCACVLKHNQVCKIPKSKLILSNQLVEFSCYWAQTQVLCVKAPLNHTAVPAFCNLWLFIIDWLFGQICL